ncbi:MAG: sigma-70 family RNA polymerase sigma factor [Myxococcota bacterium]
MVEDPDGELLRRWQAGDRQAGDALIERFLPTLYRFFRNKAPDEVEELAQRTWLGVLERADRLELDKGLRPYLLGVARNQLMMHLTRHLRDRARFDPGTMSIAEVSGSPSAAVAARENRRLLLDALRRLPLDLQLAVELFYWERLPLAEIATVCEVPVGTVKSRLARAKDVLRRLIRDADAAPASIEGAGAELERWAADLQRDLADDR